jgi:heat shock protein HslJ
MMRKNFNYFILGLALVLAFPACATKSDTVTQAGEGGSPSFDEAKGKEWVLDRIAAESATTEINRKKLEADGMGDAFTLFIDEDRIYGKGAPNRYFSPYTLGEDQEISIKPIAGTLMMSLVEPDGLQEREYYNYLEQVNQWELTGNTLELYSETPEGEPVILVFTSGAKTNGN